MPQLKLSSIDNRRLFSNHYLQNRVPKSQAWRDFDKAREAFERMKELYKRKGTKQQLSQQNERQLRKDFIEPVLDLINPHYLVDETIPGPLEPDFVFFETEELKLKNDLSNAIAVGDAKAWGTSFDAPISKGVRSPVRQLYDYFIQAETRWGILVDGMRWRLMLKDVRQEYFFEINLVDILEKDDFDNFRYFYFFFRQEAFGQDSRKKCYLDRVVEGSNRYAQEVGEELKERVYKALLVLARGFSEWRSNALDASDPATRERIRENCLILLYRFLFVFYAEDWEFLPRDDSRYRQIGLGPKLDEIIKELRHGGSAIPTEIHNYWDSLKNLFELIDNGNDELDIPPYNGGLFHLTSDGGILGGDDFLEEYAIGNRYLAEAVHLLATATDPETGEEIRVDYSSLETRHLGSIYEGLLEFKLAYAKEPKVVVKRKGKEVWIPLREYEGKTLLEELPDDRRVEQGALYLETEKHERKVTGTYYTPDYIVKYIVENTVGPIADERMRVARKAGKNLSEALLAIRICDPAMGSGHFLVEATEFLSQKLLDAVEEDVSQEFGEAEEPSLQWAKRKIASHCIYGVDLNPLAVELSKLSLWLATISKDKPLSFLDHRLKCGNSLIGSWLSDVGWFPGEVPKTVRIPQTIVDRVVKAIREIQMLPSRTLEDIQKKEGIHKRMCESSEFERLKTLLDIRTSLFFGNDFSTKSYSSKQKYMFFLNDTLAEDHNRWTDGKRFSGVTRGIEEARRRGFFHWEIEFPDVFFDEGKKAKNPGFSCVVGNPPYVNVEKIPSDERAFLMEKENYTTPMKRMDLFVPFQEQSIRLLARGGRHSFIVPFPLLTQDYGQRLRMFFLDNTIIERVVDLSRWKIFPDATVRNIIPIFEKRTPPAEYGIEIITQEEDPGLIQRIHGSVKLVDATQFRDTYENMFRIDISPALHDIQEKIDEKSVKFGKIFAASWGARGIPTIEFHLDEPVNELCRRMIKGGNINRYRLEYSGKWLLYDRKKLYRPSMPVFFESPKILFQEVTGQHGLIGTCDMNGYYTDHSLICCIPKHYFEEFDDRELRKHKIYVTQEEMDLSKEYDSAYVLALMNSRVNGFYFAKFVGYDLNVYPENIEYLPIQLISFNTPKEERISLVKKAKNFYENEDFGSALDFMDGCLPIDNEGNLSSDREKSDVVHDFLAILGTQMVEINARKQDQIELFFTDLEGVVEEGVFKALQKGKQGRSLYKKKKCRAYVGKDSFTPYHLDMALTWSREAFKDFVKILAGRVSNLSDIMQVYDKYHADVLELQERIDKTDGLIDQIVYRLYGLTDKEIRVVEESFEKRGK